MAAVGWAKARSAVPTFYQQPMLDGGHASLCPPYELPGVPARLDMESTSAHEVRADHLSAVLHFRLCEGFRMPAA